MEGIISRAGARIKARLWSPGIRASSSSSSSSSSGLIRESHKIKNLRYTYLRPLSRPLQPSPDDANFKVPPPPPPPPKDDQGGAGASSSSGGDGGKLLYGEFIMDEEDLDEDWPEDKEDT